MISAYQLALMARESKEGGKKIEVALEDDRFGMVRTALQESCYTVDGKIFFPSKKRLDAHYRRNKFEVKEIKQRKLVRAALTTMSNVPLEQ